LTRQKPSEPELNAWEELGKIFDRFRLSQGWNLKDGEEDHDDRTTAFIEILGAAKIPVRHWEKLYRKAMVTRGMRRARNEQNSFFITPEEFIAEYEGLMKELAEKPQDKPCPQPHDDEEDRLVEYMFAGGTDGTLLPCHLCRKDAYHKRIAERIEQKKANTLRLVE
jgi:hypothetical protein